MEERQSYNWARGIFGKFSWLLIVLGVIGIYYGLHDLLPGFDRPLADEELRDGIAMLTSSAFWLAVYFAGDMIPKSRDKYVGAIMIVLIVVWTALIIWD